VQKLAKSRQSQSNVVQQPKIEDLKSFYKDKDDVTKTVRQERKS